MNKLVLVLWLLFSVTSNAQIGELVLVNTHTQKERIIKENKRIQIITNEQIKVRGRFTILDDKTLMIKGVPYKLTDISIIRRSPQFDAIMTIVNMVWIGGWSLVAGIYGVIPIYFALPITAATTYSIFEPPNWNKPYAKKSNWNYTLRISKNDTRSLSNNR